RAYHEHEIAAILRELGRLGGGALVLDAGCGNGYATLKYATASPDAFFMAFDYSKPMIEAAKAAAMAGEVGNVQFEFVDVVKLDSLNLAVDTLISTRCLINLTGWNQQAAVLRQYRRLIKPNGRLILVENTIEGLRRLNELRGKLDLHEIKQRHHN